MMVKYIFKLHFEGENKIILMRHGTRTLHIALFFFHFDSNIQSTYASAILLRQGFAAETNTSHVSDQNEDIFLTSVFFMSLLLSTINCKHEAWMCYSEVTTMHCAHIGYLYAHL